MKIKEQKSQELKEKYNFFIRKKNTIYEIELKFEKIDEAYKYDFKKTNSELKILSNIFIKF